jgi:DnaJ-class molecular chaperone
MKSPRPTTPERPVHAVPKPSGKASSSKGDKTAPIKRTNLPDTVACPECSTGLQDVETCTTCDGTGRITAKRARSMAAPGTAEKA